MHHYGLLINNNSEYNVKMNKNKELCIFCPEWSEENEAEIIDGIIKVHEDCLERYKRKDSTAQEYIESVKRINEG